MKRTKKKVEETNSENEKMIKWVKTGGGTFTTKDGRVIKSGEIFYAPAYVIPKTFRDIIVPVDEQAEIDE